MPAHFTKPEDYGGRKLMSKATIDQLAEFFDLLSKEVITAEMVQNLIDKSKKFLVKKEGRPPINKRKTEQAQTSTKNFKTIKKDALSEFKRVIEESVAAGNFSLVVELVEKYFSTRDEKAKFFGNLIRSMADSGDFLTTFELIESMQYFQYEPIFFKERIPWTHIGLKAIEARNFEMARFIAERTHSSSVCGNILFYIAEKTLNKFDYEAVSNYVSKYQPLCPWRFPPGRLDRLDKIRRAVEEKVSIQAD